MMTFLTYYSSSTAYKVLIALFGISFATFVTEAQCVGTFFCSIYQKLPCQQLGCVWTGDFLWGSCSRGPDTLICEDLSTEPELCQLAQGCTYMTQCIADQGGEPLPVCYGTRPETCSDREAQSDCKRMDGCLWVGNWLWGHCEGTPTPCEDYSHNPEACDWQEGCHFSYDPPKPGETFCETMLPMKADLSCVPDDSNCEKCRDTVDGHVCFYYPGLVMTVGDMYCQNVRECSDFSIAFDCGNAIVNKGPKPKCVGQDCRGNCIYKAPDGPRDEDKYPCGPNAVIDNTPPGDVVCSCVDGFEGDPYDLEFGCTASPEGVCCGTRPETCSGQKAQSNCKRMDDCLWVGNWLWGHCEGTPTPCEDYSHNPEACDWQEGCHFSS